ncbi:hypothetical protein Ocin01_19371 [Orchesella cincta]|uniref:Uncharacterized protein n=1 Tax=Orchesella cincta TaxID=48709 RepID=A0A1D2M322_ORCCI|nr:hypothetical protein Ocin01_19371 [Orchesella cincta]
MPMTILSSWNPSPCWQPQCNKLSSKSPPPLADAAVGKGFHPWKKSPAMGLGPPTSVMNHPNVTSASIPTTGAGVMAGNGSSPNSASLPHGGVSILSAAQRSLANSVSVSSANHNTYSRTPVSSSCNVTPGYGADLYFHGSTNATSCGDQSPPGFIGKVEGGVGAAVAGVYSRVPYDSWPFNAMSGAHTGIKPDMSGMNGSSWWDAVHGAARVVVGWMLELEVQSHKHLSHQGCIILTMPIIKCQTTMTTLPHTYPCGLQSSYPDSGQHLLQDTYKSMLPTQGVGSSVASPFGLGQASLPQIVFTADFECKS